MKVFISWSGDRSRRVAGELYEWLKRVLPGQITPWMSSEDLEPGGRWEEELDDRLSEMNAGITILTPENLASTWLHYEAGAIGKAVGQARVITFLINLSPSDVPRPLGKFQHTLPTRDGIARLVTSLNKLMGQPIEPVVVDDLIEQRWPLLDAFLQQITTSAPSVSSPRRNEYDLLEEVVNLLREMSRPVSITSRTASPLRSELMLTPQDFEQFDALIAELTQEERRARFLDWAANDIRRGTTHVRLRYEDEKDVYLSSEPPLHGKTLDRLAAKAILLDFKLHIRQSSLETWDAPWVTVTAHADPRLGPSDMHDS